MTKLEAAKIELARAEHALSVGIAHLEECSAALDGAHETLKGAIKREMAARFELRAIESRVAVLAGDK
jgi:hypothetical protein